MSNTPEPMNRLVAELARLPGIGGKTAARLAHHILKSSLAEARALAEAISSVKEKLFHCSNCGAITDCDPCKYCSDPQRDRTRLCVVEEPFNIEPLERTGEFRGLYHVLMGALSPQRGIGPAQLEIESLMSRLDEVVEVIIASNPNVDGEATALYISRLIKPRGIKVTRLAFGMPVGGDIEYTDEVTLARSLAGRQDL